MIARIEDTCQPLFRTDPNDVVEDYMRNDLGNTVIRNGCTGAFYRMRVSNEHLAVDGVGARLFLRRLRIEECDLPPHTPRRSAGTTDWIAVKLRIEIYDIPQEISCRIK